MRMHSIGFIVNVLVFCYLLTGGVTWSWRTRREKIHPTNWRTKRSTRKGERKRVYTGKRTFSTKVPLSPLYEIVSENFLLAHNYNYYCHLTITIVIVTIIIIIIIIIKNFILVRYEKQLEQEEQAYQQQRRRLYAEVQEEKERVALQAQKQRQELDEARAALEVSKPVTAIFS